LERLGKDRVGVVLVLVLVLVLVVLVMMKRCITTTANSVHFILTCS
jgi:hypothetical protein